MEDKFTHDLIDSLNSEDLQLDFDFINEEELDKINVDTNSIKKNTYEKIGINKIRKYKTKKFVNIAATIVLALIIGTPVALAFMNKLYKYDKSSGSIIKSESPIYVLKNPITQKVGNGEITVNGFLVMPDEESIEIDEIANNIVGYDKLEADVLVNGKYITDQTFDDYEEIGSSWQKSTGIPYKVKKGDKFEYVITLMDKEKNKTELKFDIKLEEAKSVEEYNSSIPKDTKNNIVISAITKEENNILYAELMAIPGVDKFDFDLDWYGNHINENKGSNIFLVDGDGKRIEGDYHRDDNKQNTFMFDISDLKRPFTIEVSEINVSNSDNKDVEVKLPKLKLGESIEYNKTISLYDENNLLTKDSHNVFIKRISRKNTQDVDNKPLDTIILDVEYIDNESSNTKLENLGILSNISWFGFGKFDFSSVSQEKYRGDNYKYSTIYIYPNNGDTKEKAISVGFKMSADSYKIEGPWELKID